LRTEPVTRLWRCDCGSRCVMSGFLAARGVCNVGARIVVVALGTTEVWTLGGSVANYRKQESSVSQVIDFLIPDFWIWPQKGKFATEPHGVFPPIDVPNATVTFPGGINNQGEIVGLYIDNAGGGGFMLRNSTFTNTPAPPGAFQGSFAVDIDDRGRILGFYF
jgi:hypothetical protein